jgi:hypothetical protein
VRRNSESQRVYREEIAEIFRPDAAAKMLSYLFPACLYLHGVAEAQTGMHFAAASGQFF